MFVYSFVPTPIAALTNPLTLTYAAIHSHTLAMSARGLSQMDFLSPKTPTTTLTPAAISSAHGKYSPLLPYRLAKLILHTTRFIMTIALGFAGWVMTARQLSIGEGSEASRKRLCLRGRSGCELHRLGSIGCHGRDPERHRRRGSNLLWKREADGCWRRRILHSGGAIVRRPGGQ